MLCLECGTVCNRDLDSHKSRQETVRSLRGLDLEKNSKISWKDEVTNASVFEKVKDEGRKTHAKYNLAMIAQMAGHVLRNEILFRRMCFSSWGIK